MQEIPRFISREGRSNLILYGMRRRLLDDFYHSFLSESWRKALLTVIAFYLAVNFLFALAYLEVGGVENARAGSFADAFFFSVQTLATIGYGKMSPISIPAHLLVTVESFLGILGIALTTGLVLAKFARPTARVLWSDSAVIAMMDGIPSLMIRVANTRGNQVVEAQMRLGMLRSEVTKEGEPIRRMYDLRLIRPSTAVFGLTWLAVHPITAESPLHGQTPEQLRSVQAQLYASLLGLDATFSQTIHSRRSWTVDEIRWGERFEDILGPLPDGRMGVDYTKFQRTRPAPLPKGA
jgi:inward rectifier potassium channel